MHSRWERGFEAAIWRARFFVGVAVLGSLLASLTIFYMATTDTLYMVLRLWNYASPALDAAARTDFHDQTVRSVVEIVDGYLLATVLLMFALGLYELFVSKIDEARDSEARGGVLVIRSLDDLKNRLAKVIILILIVKFFEMVMKSQPKVPLDLVYVAAGIALVSAALWFTHASDKSAG